MNASFHRILVCRTDRLGDVILTLPVLTNLRLAGRLAHIAFLGTEYSRKIVQDNPYLDEFIAYDPGGRHAGFFGLFTLAGELRRAKFDTVLHVFPRFKVSLAAFLAGIKRRIGPATRWYSFLYNTKLDIHRSQVEKHELEYNLEYLAPLKVPVKDTKIRLWLGSKDRKYASVFFKENKLSGKVVAVHPGGASGSMYNWNIARYSELINLLQEKLKVKVLLVEGKDEEDLSRRLLSRVKHRPPLLSGKADLRQLGAVLEKVAVLISKNTGTMHTAAAVGTPTISFFSPVFVISEKRWGPWGNKGIIMKPKIAECKICSGENCIYHDCMDTIKVAEVIKKVRQFI